jgi:hypothetical protein
VRGLSPKGNLGVLARHGANTAVDELRIGAPQHGPRAAGRCRRNPLTILQWRRQRMEHQRRDLQSEATATPVAQSSPGETYRLKTTNYHGPLSRKRSSETARQAAQRCVEEGAGCDCCSHCSGSSNPVTRAFGIRRECDPEALGAVRHLRKVVAWMAAVATGRTIRAFVAAASRLLQRSCRVRSRAYAALMRPRWVKAWGKFPRCSPSGPSSSA